MQQQNHHQANGNENTQFLPPLPPQVGGTSGGTMGSNSIRPGSMADRARLAKIPPPETALKCPRCDSTNTKFCYFNNYSLTQPRHFCKTCRRYWTRGGNLRNVPVGGGCRRNKKNKRSRSKSPSNSEKQTLISTSSGNPSHDLTSQFPQPHNLPFMASLQNLNSYGVGNMGLGDHMGFQMGGSNSSASAAAGGGVEQWRLQQFPFLNTFEGNSGGSYPFQGESIEAQTGFVGDSRVTQQPPVKMEENGGLNNLTRSSLSGSEQHNNNNQYYSWTDLSGLAPSTTHDLL